MTEPFIDEVQTTVPPNAHDSIPPWVCVQCGQPSHVHPEDQPVIFDPCPLAHIRPEDRCD